MSIKISHPYTDTPYDVLSVPEDPSIGLLPMDASLKIIKGVRFPQLIKWWTAHPKVQPKRSQQELAKAVDQMGFPGRVLIDIFLSTMLDKASDFDELIKNQENLPLKLSAPPLDEWENGLEPWLVPPVDEITIEEISVSHQHNYDDPQIDLYEVRFDF